MSGSIFLSPRQAEREFGLSRWYFYHKVYSGELPAKRYGRRLMIPRKKIEELLQIPPEWMPEKKKG